LIVLAIRAAVVKSGFLSASLRLVADFSAKGTSRSMIAPLAIRAVVITPRVNRAAAPCALKPETATGPCATA
jgi:hypothetical protein